MTTPTPAQHNTPEPRWRRVLGWLTRYVIPAACSVLLIVWFFRMVNLRRVVQIVRGDCNMWIIGAMMVIVVLSHMSRGIRWGIQLRAVGVPRMPVVAEWCTIFGAYALNLVFPRLGEVWRCVYVSKTWHTPFTTVLGTDFGDRGSDLLCVLVLLGLALIVSHAALDRFFDHYAIGRVVKDVVENGWLWAFLATVVIVVWALIRYRSGWRWVQRMHRGLLNIWHGFAVLFRLDQLSLYVWLTVSIWVCYFAETYICFFAFPFTRELVMQPGMAWGLVPGLICLVFGSSSTIVPSNGGLGPWTIATAYALVIFGLPEGEAAAYALVVWGFQALTLILLGLFTAGYIMVQRRRGGAVKAAAPGTTPQ